MFNNRSRKTDQRERESFSEAIAAGDGSRAKADSKAIASGKNSVADAAQTGALGDGSKANAFSDAQATGKGSEAKALSFSEKPVANTTSKSKAVPKKGSQLAFLRDKAGLTQVELAAVLGVSLTTIQSWEKGGLPNIQKYYRLAQVRDCDLEDLEEPDEEDSYAPILDFIRNRASGAVRAGN